MQDKRVRFLLNTGVIAVILGLFFVVFKFAVPLLLPFLISLIIALIIQRPITFLSQKLKLSQKIVAPVVTLLFELVVVGLVVLVIYRVLAELGDFVSRLPTWFNHLAPGVTAEVNEFLNRFLSHFAPEMAEDFRNIFKDFTNYLQSAIVNISMSGVNWAATQLSRLPSLLLTTVIAVVASFFMAGKTDRMKAGLLRQLPPERQELISTLYTSVWRTLWRMLRSYLLLMCITFCELALGLWALGLNYFLIIAAFIALVDLLPVLGTGTILIPWSILELIIGDTKLGICLLVLYIVITVIRNVLEPKLVGRQIGLNPILTLMGMYVGLRLFGILGMFLVPMMMILVKRMNDMGVIHIWKTADAPEAAETPPPSTVPVESTAE